MHVEVLGAENNVGGRQPPTELLWHSRLNSPSLCSRPELLVLSFLLSASNCKLCYEQMLTCRMLTEPLQLDCLVHLQDCPIEDVIHALLTWLM